MQKESIGDRIRRKRKELKLTQKRVANSVGVSAGAVTQWELRYTDPKGKNLHRLAATLKCSPEWLLTGKDAATATDALHDSTKRNTQYQGLIGEIDEWDSNTPLDEDEVELPFFMEVELAAGSGTCEVKENHGPKLRFAKSTLKRQGVDPANAACVKVAGNSMEPVLPDGSTVGIDTAKTTIVDGKMFAIDHDGMLRVKTLYRVPGGGIRLKSFNNDEFPDEVYTGDEAKHIRVIGKVFWYSVLI